MGKNCHELLMAPKPDNNPRITVPMTMSRERYAARVPEASTEVGTGTYERTNRYNPIIARAKNVLKEIKRFLERLEFEAG